MSMRWDETWHRLREWTSGQGPSERLAGQILIDEKFTGLDPSHPLGGPDGKKDAIAWRDNSKWVMAVYFPRGQQSFQDIKSKFLSDAQGVAENGAAGMAFVTNQELRLSERAELEELVTHKLELYHLERITAILDKPSMQATRAQFLAIDANDSSDLGVWLDRRSAERRRIRLASFDVTDDQVGEFLGSIHGPDVPLGTVRVLVGPFGSGKSEVAEAWHIGAIERLAADPSHAQIPVWLHARDVTSGGLEAVVDRTARQAWRGIRGVAVVVDGLDEVDASLAERIAEDARLLVASDRTSSVLLTTRPGVLPYRNDQIEVPGLDKDGATQLVEHLANDQHVTWTWTEELRSTMRRPFFALAAGTLLAAGDAPAGEADLIRKLVERALSRTDSRSAVTSAEVFSVLTKLAVESTRTGNLSDGLTFRERQIALGSRLVTPAASGEVAFALPIFQQWFAAQALLTVVSAGEVVGSPRSFERWRWAAAIAALDSNVERLDGMIEHWLRANPGAGAWILEQASFSHRAWRVGEEEPLDADDARRRLLLAFRVWIDASGPFAAGVFPSLAVNGPMKLGVRVSGSRVDHGWSRAGTQDEVVDLPANVHPLVPPRDAEWQADRSGVVPEGPEWPWTLVRDLIAGRTLNFLNTVEQLGPTNGVWHRERRYQVARILTRTTSMLHPPIPATSVLSAAHKLIRHGEEPDHTTFNLSRKIVRGEELIDLVDWIEANQLAHVESPLPSPDRPHPTGGMVWDLYSPEALMRFTAEAYGSACIAYDEALQTVFTNFAWSFGAGAAGPFGFLLDMAYGTAGIAGDNAPLLTAIRLPLELLRDCVEQNSTLLVSSTGRAAIKLIDDSGSRHRGPHRYQPLLDRAAEWAANRDPGSFWNPGSIGNSIADHMTNGRPASNIAAQWIWGDLKLLGLAKGTFPQLR
jgi:hypothetical protein